MKETAFKEKVVKELLAVEGCWVEKIQQVGKRGTPDLLCCVRGWFVGLELKATSKNRPTILQEYKLARIQEAGGIALVVHPENWAVVKATLEALPWK